MKRRESMSFRFLLYVEPTNRACLAAMKICANIKEPIYILDVRKLDPVPGWLNGYPSLLDRQRNYLYQGTKCITFLQKLERQLPVRPPEPRMTRLPLNPQHIIIPMLPLPQRHHNSSATIVEEIPDARPPLRVNRPIHRPPEKAVEPTEPVEPAKLAEPTDPVEPAKPTEPVEPAEPTEPAEPAEPAEHVEPPSENELVSTDPDVTEVTEVTEVAVKRPTRRRVATTRRSRKKKS
uniref:Uncharacterized protein n=1 Tax=viral metagenome TaxID=1070528 RepID=A0A6C0BMW7_9ZZZZ